MAELLQNTNLKIEAYSFAEFLTEFQEAVLQGFRLDLDSNENFPQKFGDHLYAILVPSDAFEIVAEEEVVSEPEVQTEVTPEVQPTPSTRTRKSRNADVS